MTYRITTRQATNRRRPRDIYKLEYREMVFAALDREEERLFSDHYDTLCDLIHITYQEFGSHWGQEELLMAAEQQSDETGDNNPYLVAINNISKM